MLRKSKRHETEFLHCRKFTFTNMALKWLAKNLKLFHTQVWICQSLSTCPLWAWQGAWGVLWKITRNINTQASTGYVGLHITLPSGCLALMCAHAWPSYRTLLWDWDFLRRMLIRWCSSNSIQVRSSSWTHKALRLACDCELEMPITKLWEMLATALWCLCHTQ